MGRRKIEIQPLAVSVDACLLNVPIVLTIVYGVVRMQGTEQ